MFGLIKIIGLLTGLANGSNHRKCMSLNNWKCITQPSLINSNECSQKFHYYPLAIKLDKYVGSCDTLNDLFNKVCVPNKTVDLNLSLFNMITRINESKSIRKHMSCKCKCKFDGKNVIEISNGIAVNVDMSVKSTIFVKNIIFGILLYVVAETKKN